jgi:hypothetical protein
MLALITVFKKRCKSLSYKEPVKIDVNRFVCKLLFPVIWLITQCELPNYVSSKLLSKATMKLNLCFEAYSQNCGGRLLASSCLSIRPSVRLSARNNSAPTGRIFIIFDTCVFSKICREKSSFVKILYVKTNLYFWSYFVQFSLQWRMFRTEVVREIKTNFYS